ncbi:MAG TPA: recombinase family protein [Ktedonobacteraceae bacterium]|nr:recombinase family protein [Ktedonobacteraceae bacterium]
MPKKKFIRAAGYPRVSDPSKKDSTTLESQAKSIRAYCEEHGYVLEECHMYPEAQSAYLLPYRERPQLRKMLEAARRHEFDVIVVTEFNRLSRRQIEQAVIIDLLDHANVKAESVTENFDDSAIGNFMKSVYAFIGEVEREKIVERTMRGRRDRIENGNLPGNGIRLYGYQFIDTKEETNARYIRNTHIIKITEDGTRWTEVMVVEFIYDSILQGMSLRSIAMSLSRMGIPTYMGKDHWHPTTIQQIATNRFYAGKATAGKFLKGDKNKHDSRLKEGKYKLPEGVVEPIISFKVFEQVQERLSQNKSFAIRNNKYPVTTLLRAGLCRCGICGCSMHVVNEIDRRNPAKEFLRPRYTCQRNNGLEGLANCHTVAISSPFLDEKAWEFAVTHIKNPELVRAKVEEIRSMHERLDDSTHIEHQVEEIRRKISNLYKLAESAADNDTIAMLQQRLAQLEKEKRGLELLLQDAADEEEKAQEIEEALEKFEKWAQEVRPFLDDPSYTTTYEDKRTAMLILGIQATVWPASNPQRFKLELAPPQIVSAIRYY